MAQCRSLPPGRNSWTRGPIARTQRERLIAGVRHLAAPSHAPGKSPGSNPRATVVAALWIFRKQCQSCPISKETRGWRSSRIEDDRSVRLVSADVACEMAKELGNGNRTCPHTTDTTGSVSRLESRGSRRSPRLRTVDSSAGRGIVRLPRMSTRISLLSARQRRLCRASRSFLRGPLFGFTQVDQNAWTAGPVASGAASSPGIACDIGAGWPRSTG